MAKAASALRTPRASKSEHTPEAHHLKDAKAESAFDKDKKWDSEDKSNTFNNRRRMDSLTEHLGCTCYYAKMRWSWFGYSPYGLFIAFDVSRFYHEKKLALDIGVNQTTQITEKKKELCEANGIKYYLISSPTDLKNFAELNV